MQMSQHIINFGNYIQIHKGYSPLTVKAYSFDLNQFNSYLNEQELPNKIKEIKQQHIYSYLAYLSHPDDGKKPISVTSRARKLSSIKSFFSYLQKHKYIESNPTSFIELPNLPEKEPDYLTETEYRRLLQTVKEKATPYFLARDYSIIVMFLTTGIRVSELTSLRLEDVDLEEGFIRVIRKRNKQQTIPLNKQCIEALTVYLKTRDDNNSHLYLSKQKSPLRSNSVYYLVKKYLEAASISKSSSGPHLLRHTCFTTLLSKGVTPIIIQELAGHTSLDTTRRYLHLNNKQVREAVNKLNI